MPGMPGMHAVPYTLHNALTRWQVGPFAVLVLAALITAGVWYVHGTRLLRTRGRSWSRWRTVAFLSGLVALDAALQSPVATFTMGYFQAHVVQHLLLMV